MGTESVLLQSSGCLAHHTKPRTSDSLDEPQETFPYQHQTVRKPSILEDFWSSSACDMDNSAVQSQGSISSISTGNQTLDPNSGASSANNPDFVNNGLILWNQTRQRWLGKKRSENQVKRTREPKFNWNVTYESLLGSNKPFPQPIPLAEMVDFLVDVWEQEGMYD